MFWREGVFLKVKIEVLLINFAINPLRTESYPIKFYDTVSISLLTKKSSGTEIV